MLASCGGDDDDDGGSGGGASAASFCEVVKTVPTSDDGGQRVRSFLASAWNKVMDAWDAQHASEVDLQATQKAGAKVLKYIRDECGLSDQKAN